MTEHDSTASAAPGRPVICLGDFLPEDPAVATRLDDVVDGTRPFLGTLLPVHPESARHRAATAVLLAGTPLAAVGVPVALRTRSSSRPRRTGPAGGVLIDGPARAGARRERVRRPTPVVAGVLALVGLAALFAAFASPAPAPAPAGREVVAATPTTTPTPTVPSAEPVHLPAGPTVDGVVPVGTTPPATLPATGRPRPATVQATPGDRALAVPTVAPVADAPSATSATTGAPTTASPTTGATEPTAGAEPTGTTEPTATEPTATEPTSTEPTATGTPTTDPAPEPGGDTPPAEETPSTPVDTAGGTEDPGAGEVLAVLALGGLGLGGAGRHAVRRGRHRAR